MNKPKSDRSLVRQTPASVLRRSLEKQSKINARKTGSRLGVSALMLLCGAASANASLLVYEGFDYNLANGVSMNGVASDAVGLTGGYVNYNFLGNSAAGNSASSVFARTGLTFGPNFLTNGGAVALSVTSTTAVANTSLVGAKLNTGTVTGTIYSSYLVRFTALSTSSSTPVLSQRLCDDAVGTNTTLRSDAEMNGATAKPGIAYGNNVATASASAGTLALDTTYLVVSKFTGVGLGAGGVASQWVFTQAAYDSWVAAGSVEANLASFATFTASQTSALTPAFYNGRWAQFGVSTSTAATSEGAIVDELSYGTTLADVLWQPIASAWKSVPLGGGGWVTGLVSNASGNLIYCRTDVGGAFRWVADADGNNGTWISITDTMVPFGTSGQAELMSVESIAVDPGKSSRVYAAFGNKSIGTARRGIYVSDDQGETWALVPSTNTFVIQGNGNNRANGERLAVDPNNSNIIWYGSTTSGLRKFVKSGSTWTATQISATDVPFGTVDNGNTFVALDKNSGSTIVYVGVADASNGGVFKSTDGGATWTKVITATSPRRGQVAIDGTLYVTLGSAGAAKLTRTGTLTTLSTLPAGLVYSGIATDPNNALNLYIAEAKARDGVILRSNDGGASWLNQGTTFNEGPATAFNHARKEPDGTSSVTGYWFGMTSSLLVNPANSSELWAGDFFGVQRTRNAQAIGTNPGAWWSLLQKNQEETVVLSLRSAPTGSKLITGLSDVGGAQYLNTNARPSGVNGRKFSNQSDGNNTSIDFSEANNNVWARAWVSSSGSGGSGATSGDGGANWAAFGQLDAKTITNDAVGGWETFELAHYLKQQQALGATSVTLVVKGSYWQSPGPMLKFSSKEGTNPPQLVINGSSTLTPAADAFVYSQGQNTSNPALSTGSSITNYGNHTQLHVQSYYDLNDQMRYTYLKFDLTGIPTITSATLRLYRIAATDTAAIPATLNATPTTSWVEGNGGTDNLPANELTWKNRPVDLYVAPSGASGGRVAVSATNPNNIVWWPIWQAPLYSTNRGVTWTTSTGAPVSQITGIYTNGNSTSIPGKPLASDRVNGDFYIGRFEGGQHRIYRSSDNGATWAQVGTVNNGNTYNMRTPQLVPAPASPTFPSGGDIWLCDDNTYNNVSGGGGLWRSTNGGGSWTKSTTMGIVSQVSFGKPASGSTGYTVFVNGVKSGVAGIYRSDDYGATWTLLPSPTINMITAVEGDRQNYGKVFIGTGGRGTFVNQ